MDFYITPDVLIPRPETELLVEQGLAWLVKHSDIHTGYDIGTGSGNIAISLACNHPNLHMVAVDTSEAALAVAEQNINQHGLSDRIQLIQSNLLESVPINEYHFLCANLPYIPRGEVLNLQVAQYEPIKALDGGLDGLDYYRTLIEQVAPFLSQPFCLLLEIEYRQSDAIRLIIQNAISGAEIQIFPDLAGLPRIVKVEGEVDHGRH